MAYVPKLITAVVLAFVLAGCHAPQSASESSQAATRLSTNAEMFDDFAFASSVRHFPKSYRELRACTLENHYPCLFGMRKVMQARDRLLAMDHDSALDMILAQIDEDCGDDPLMVSELPDETDMRCFGALSALYYFNSDSDDEKIRATFGAMSMMEKQHIFKTVRVIPFGWAHNRRNIDAWDSWLRTQDDINHLSGPALRILEMPPEDAKALNTLLYMDIDAVEFGP